MDRRKSLHGICPHLSSWALASLVARELLYVVVEGNGIPKRNALFLRYWHTFRKIEEELRNFGKKGVALGSFCHVHDTVYRKARAQLFLCLIVRLAKDKYSTSIESCALVIPADPRLKEHTLPIYRMALELRAAPNT